MMATAIAVAIVVYSCKAKLSEAEVIDMSKAPLQAVDSMTLVQTKNGIVEMRVVTGRMEKYETDSLVYELFPEGMNVFAYKEDGVLESTIVSESARHETKKGSDEEVWMATGNVVVRNIVNGQVMETDTIYWDRKNHQIHTDCYIRLFSLDGFMQGYGMESDERARNAIILRPFNSYGVVVQDTTEVVIDSANFIGPLLRK